MSIMRACLPVLLVMTLFMPAQVWAAGFDLQKAQSYVESQYDSSLGLVRENEHIGKYWLWSDNELAAVVLREHAPAISENITNSILAYKQDSDLEFRSAYGAILGKDSAFLTPLNKNITEKVWYTDFAGGSELECADYADVAFLKAIYYYKAGDYAKSTECYMAGQGMFDGTGFKDKAFAADGNRYSTYKVALWKIAADSARGGEEGAARATEILEKMQDGETGGVYTHYTPELAPDSQTNVETTTLAVIAFDGSLLQPKMPPPTKEQLQECAELGIEKEKCSDAALLDGKCLEPNCGGAGTTNIEALQNPTMLATFGLLAAGIGGGTLAFYVKTRKRQGTRR